MHLTWFIDHDIIRVLIASSSIIPSATCKE